MGTKKKTAAAPAADVTVALTVRDPQHDAKALELASNAADYQKKVSAITLAKPEHYESATALLITINGFVKAIDSQRLEFVKPLKEHAKRIDAHFKAMSDPLESAVAELKRKMAIYRQQEQERADRERRRQEEEAAAKAREAAALEAKAANAKGKKARDLTAQAEAAKSEALAIATETVAAEPAKTVRVASGAVTARRVWTFEVTDALKVPREYLVVDETAIRRAVQAGIRTIDGVRIFEDEKLSVRG